MKANKYVLLFREACERLLNGKVNLLEMVTLTNKSTSFSFIVMLNSNDHTPKHLHFLNKSDKELLVKIEIPDVCPKTIEDIKGFSWKIKETNGFKKEVLMWFNSLDEDGDLNWKVALNVWNNFHNE